MDRPFFCLHTEPLTAAVSPLAEAATAIVGFSARNTNVISAETFTLSGFGEIAVPANSSLTVFAPFPILLRGEASFDPGENESLAVTVFYI